MRRRAVVLTAVSPQGLAVARELLGEEFELVAVHTTREALARLSQGGIDTILAGLHFDDSLMPALLQAVKTNASTRALPFVCCRFLPTQLQRASLSATAQVCEVLGAQFVDVLKLQQNEGHAAAAQQLRSMMLQALQPEPRSRRTEV